MTDLELFVFDYNYSSWSMRAGIVLRLSGLAYTETRLHLDGPTLAGIVDVSRSRLLPLLRHGELRVWDSLAIAEYVAELCPEQALWPRDASARAVARSASAEMHSGFSALRSAMPMNIRAHYAQFARSQEVQASVLRIKELWSDLRQRAAQRGDYLCGEFGIVDAMFAPVVTRFRTYDVKLEGAHEAYAQAVLRHPAVTGWLDKAREETSILARSEYAVG